MGERIFSQTEKSQLVKLYLGGISRAKIAAQFKTSVQNIEKTLSSQGVILKKRNSTPNLIGKKFGKLSPIEKVGPDWACECDCGTLIKIRPHKLLSGISKNCNNCKGAISGKFLRDVYLDRLKARAAAKKIDFNLTCTYLEKLYTKQNGLCALSGEPITILYNLVEMTASLDRIDSKKGYVKGNVQWLHKTVNILKLDFSQEYFIQMCKNITSYNQNGH